jgi:hypothetical protein
MRRYRVTLRHAFDGTQLVQSVFAACARDAHKNVSKRVEKVYRVMNVREV